MASGIYNKFWENLAKGLIDFTVNDGYKMALVDDTYTFSKNNNTWQTGSDPYDSEVTGTNYTAGGKLMGQGTVTYDGANDRGVLDAPNTTWPLSTITAKYGICYKVTGVYLCFCFDFGSNKSSSNGDFTLNYNAVGILTLAQAA
jgi:hypothetical protein